MMYLYPAYYCYGAWFLAFFLIPVLVLYRRTTLSLELLELKGLMLKPRLLGGRIVSMSNNMGDFFKQHEKLKGNNLLVKILQAMCNDADKGICHSPDLYLTGFRSSLRKFVLWVLLGSHIPFFVLMYFKHEPFWGLVQYQICCYVLLYLLEMALQYKYMNFVKMFYTNWYDKILNLDLLMVSMIRNDVENIKNLSNSHELLAAVEKFASSNSQLTEELVSHTAILSARLEEFTNVQEKTSGISAQTVVLSLDDCIKRFDEVHGNLQKITRDIDHAFNSLVRITETKKDEVNALNKNADILSDIRENFKTYKSEAVEAEIMHLQKTTELLENNVGSAFLSIGTAISQNFTRLESSYDEFFDMCKKMSETVSANYEEKTSTILNSLSNKLVAEFTTIKERMEGLTAIIERTSESTKLVCETVFDFAQYNKAPGFMDKITGYVNFSNKLKDAAGKIIAYEKLAALGLTAQKNDGAEKNE